MPAHKPKTTFNLGEFPTAPDTQRNHVIPVELFAPDPKGQKTTHIAIQRILELGTDSTKIFDFASGRDNGQLLPSSYHSGSREKPMAAANDDGGFSQVA